MPRQLGMSDFALGDEENFLLHSARLTSNDVPLRRSQQASCALGSQRVCRSQRVLTRQHRDAGAGLSHIP